MDRCPDCPCDCASFIVHFHGAWSVESAPSNVGGPWLDEVMTTKSARHDSPRRDRLNLRAFDRDSPHLAEINGAISSLEDVEAMARSVEVTRIATLARVARIVCDEAERQGCKGHVEESLAYRAARADVAAVLHLSERSVDRRLSYAVLLTQSYSATLQRLRVGQIDARHAQVITDAGGIIIPVGQAETPELVARRETYERKVLEIAVTTTPNRLQPIAKRLAEMYACEELDARYERAQRLRMVWVSEREDGMAELGAYLPAHEAKAIHSRLTQIAERVQKIETREFPETPEPGPLGAATPRRTRDEIRTDLFTDLLLHGCGSAGARGDADTRSNADGYSDVGTRSDAEACSDAGVPSAGDLVDVPRVRGIVQVITHEEHVSDAAIGVPGGNASGGASVRVPLPTLEGYGPIPISVARGIAGTALDWQRVRVDSTNGTVLSVDRYRPSEQMRRFLTARDAHCRFPGCRVPAHRCDIDHTIDAALGGRTSTDNLGMLCRGHHTLKHHTGWKVKQHPDGDYEWMSPTGRVHVDRPASRVRFMATEDSGSPPGQ